MEGLDELVEIEGFGGEVELVGAPVAFALDGASPEFECASGEFELGAIEEEAVDAGVAGGGDLADGEAAVGTIGIGEEEGGLEGFESAGAGIGSDDEGAGESAGGF